MSKLTQQQLLKARVHLGHITKKWNPNMAPFLFTEKKGIHIIDLNKTLEGLEKATVALETIAKSGKKIMFVATKKQASSIVEEEAKKLKQPYITERWLGGTLTNFSTIRRSLKKLANIQKIKKSITYQNLAKREKLTLQREQAKLDKLLSGISELNRIPSALFIVDIKNEAIAVKEAKKLGIPVFAMVDTNSDPNNVDYPIPSNDDSSSSISIIIKAISKAIDQGLETRKHEKENVSNKIETKKNDIKPTAAKIPTNFRKVSSSDEEKTELKTSEQKNKTSSKVISSKNDSELEKKEQSKNPKEIKAKVNDKSKTNITTQKTKSTNIKKEAIEPKSNSSKAGSKDTKPKKTETKPKS